MNIEFFLQDTFQWNGIYSKKKGQKWGRDKHTFTPRNDYKDLNKDFSEILSNGKEKLSDEGIDFDKLPLLADMPKVESCYSRSRCLFLSLQTYVMF